MLIKLGEVLENQISNCISLGVFKSDDISLKETSEFD